MTLFIHLLSLELIFFINIVLFLIRLILENYNFNKKKSSKILIQLIKLKLNRSKVS